jgi:AcrR family transcriptional regulator
MSELSPRAARTRAALIAAGFDLLAVKPIDAITIDEVVATAGVAKGSFFNHFADKHAFAAAIAADVRRELEDEITLVNAEIDNPVERIANGMRVCAEFATRDPKRTAVLLRASGNATDKSHPLNRGVSGDFDDAGRQGMITDQAARSGVLYWVGLCHALMATSIAPGTDPTSIRQRTHDMVTLGLTGLGVDRAFAAALASRVRADGELAVAAPSDPDNILISVSEAGGGFGS